jgi:hypothetical protein
MGQVCARVEWVLMWELHTTSIVRPRGAAYERPSCPSDRAVFVVLCHIKESRLPDKRKRDTYTPPLWRLMDAGQISGTDRVR